MFTLHPRYTRQGIGWHALKLNKFGSGHFLIELDYTIPVDTPSGGQYFGQWEYYFGISDTDTAPESANLVMKTWVPAPT